MELGDVDFLDGGGGVGCEAGAAAVSCSICLEAVIDNGHRSWAKLQCGHEFHLDCIGSAFNSKGAMQCPNCRKIEKGQWLYSNGSRPIPEFSIEDWAHDDDLNDLGYSEMGSRLGSFENVSLEKFVGLCIIHSIGLHWCPFTRVPSSFDEGEFPSGAYHELLGPHAVFTEHSPVSSASHPCPYVAYFGPIHPSSSVSSGSLSDGSTFNNHWNGPSGSSEVPNSYPFPSMDLQYHNLDHPPFTTNTHDQHLIPSATQRAARNTNTSDISRAGIHPFILNHSRAPRSVLPTYPSNVARARNRSSSLQTYFQQSTGNNPPVSRVSPPVVSNGQRSSSRRSGLAQDAPVSGTLSHFQRTLSHFQRWEHEQHQPLYPPGQGERDSIWSPFWPPAAGSDGGVRSGNQRAMHGSERRAFRDRS